RRLLVVTGIRYQRLEDAGGCARAKRSSSGSVSPCTILPGYHRRRAAPVLGWSEDDEQRATDRQRDAERDDLARFPSFGQTAEHRLAVRRRSVEVCGYILAVSQRRSAKPGA